jgi:hypothetical protein
MTAALFAMNVAYYNNYNNIFGNAIGQYPTGCTATNYQINADQAQGPTIYKFGYFDDGGTASPNLTLSAKTENTVLRGGNWDCKTGTIIYNSNVPSGSVVASYQELDRFLPFSLYLSKKPSWFSSSHWPAIENPIPTQVNNIPAQNCYNSGPGASQPFNPTGCYVPAPNTVTAATCSAADVTTAINSANEGDTVKVPGPCSVSWGGAPGVTISGKGIILDGGGNVTLTASYSISMKSTVTASTRVTGFIFTNGGTINNGDITATGGKNNQPYRIDHNTFTGASPTVIAAYSNGPGLVDHNTFTGGGASEMIHNFAQGATDASGWTDDIIPGSPYALYIEDNTFTNSACTSNCSFTGTSAVQSYYGARTVFRHNTLTMTQVDQHGTAGNIGARWWEIYENTFNIVSGGNQSAYMDLRAGSGLVFNNHKTGSTNLGAGNVLLREEDSGYPALYQIGRGINQDYSPSYVWGNDAALNIIAGSPTMVRCQTASDNGVASGLQGTCPTTFVYTPYTYPHPLQTGSY